ncbi:MAG: hypothetical protein H7Z75_03405 [Ferruginibacter sp.]|nr:hypothetical protein [Cytophagales bacterium]
MFQQCLNRQQVGVDKLFELMHQQGSHQPLPAF